jgi:hypothetical protein
MSIELFKIRCNTAVVKTVSLVANTWQTLLLLDHVVLNTDFSTFSFIVEDGELTVLRPCTLSIQGHLYLVPAAGEPVDVIDLTIALNVNGTRVRTMFTGLTHTRQLSSDINEYKVGDVLKLEIMSTSTLDIETSTAEENYFMITKYY